MITLNVLHTYYPPPPAGSGDIVSGNLKLILGLIWTLILHYQISMGFGINEDGGKKDGLTGRQALLEWLRVS
jgi:filamin